MQLIFKDELFSFQGRHDIITNSLAKEKNTLTSHQLRDIVQKTEGYSGADMKMLLKEAAKGPIRDLTTEELASIAINKVEYNFLSCIYS